MDKSQQSQSQAQGTKETLANRTDPGAKQELSTPTTISEVISSLS